MNKQALIEAVAAKAQVSKAEAAKVLDAALEAAVEAVKKGEGVQLIGFASISVAQKAARKAKNPRTGAVINVPARKAKNPRTGAIVEVPAKKVVKIKPGAKFAL